jgi:ATP-binding cassette subfamily B protein
LVPSTLNDPKRWEILPVKRSLPVSYEWVGFSYIPWRTVLKDFSLHISAGQKVWIVGVSGSGKTTLINLLLRFYDVNDGGIYIEQKDIRNITQEHLRSQIAHVSQDTTLFHKSIFENIRYSRPNSTQREVEVASKIAHAHEFITSLPHGYDTVVWDRWVKLSGWQRQRIAIARAILKDAPIFLLDEATSALDSESEKKVQEALHDLMKWRTVIAVAHRLSTLLSMDRIVVLNNWKIVEDGSHPELLEKNWIYRRLWDMQVWGFIPETEKMILDSGNEFVTT